MEMIILSLYFILLMLCIMLIAHPWNKSHLIVYFYYIVFVLLIFYWGFGSSMFIMAMMASNLSFFIVSFSGFDIRVRLVHKTVWKLSFLFIFLEEFKRTFNLVWILGRIWYQHKLIWVLWKLVLQYEPKF